MSIVTCFKIDRAELFDELAAVKLASVIQARGDSSAIVASINI